MKIVIVLAVLLVATMCYVKFRRPAAVSVVPATGAVHAEAARPEPPGPALAPRETAAPATPAPSALEQILARSPVPEFAPAASAAPAAPVVRSAYERILAGENIKEQPAAAPVTNVASNAPTTAYEQILRGHSIREAKRN